MKKRLLNLIIISICGCVNTIFAQDLQFTQPNIINGTDTTFNLGITTTNGQFGSAWGDYDGDGDLDFLISGQGNSHVLYRNDGAQFVNVSADVGLAANSIYAQGVVWADFNGDGALDFVTGQSGIHLYMNYIADSGKFVDMSKAAKLDTVASGNSIWAVTLGDYDKDGDLDIAFAGGSQGPNKLAGPIRILRNDDLIFTDVQPTLAGLIMLVESWSPQWVDIDNDGDLDLWLSNFRNDQPYGALLRNDDGEFNYVSEDLGLLSGSAIQSAWADYDNDGDMDLVAFSYDVTKAVTQLWRNNGGTSFTDVAAPFDLSSDEIVDSRGICWGDYDNDGDLDLLVGRALNNEQKLYRNDGNIFVDVGVESGAAGNGLGYRSALFVDYDSDGLLDISFIDKGRQLLLHNNGGNSNHWIGIRPKGGIGNQCGIGARVRVVAGSLSMIRDIGSGAGSLSGGELWAHFGLGSATMADSLIVRWPTGTVDIATNVAADAYYTFEQGVGIIVGVKDEKNVPPEFNLAQNYPNPFNPSTTISYSLKATGPVRLTVYDITGKEVAVPVNGIQNAGTHNVTFSADGFASGVYVYKLQSASELITKKMMLVK